MLLTIQCRILVFWMPQSVVVGVQQTDTWHYVGHYVGILRSWCMQGLHQPHHGPGATRQRATCILTALSDLRSQLRRIGSDLVVRHGRPEEVLPGLAKKLGAGRVYCHTEVTRDETKVSSASKRI